MPCPHPPIASRSPSVPCSPSTAPDSHPFSTSHAEQRGRQPGPQAGVGRGGAGSGGGGAMEEGAEVKELPPYSWKDSLFFQTQPKKKKKKPQAFQGPVLLADRGDATPYAGSPRASLTRSAAGSPSPRSGRTEGASPGLLGRDGSRLPAPPPGAAAASPGETASLPGDSASRKGTSSLPKKEFSLSARFLDSAAA